MKKVLFVCNGNAQRSPTFERYFKKLNDGNEYRSAGIYSGYPYIVNREILDWADIIYVMDLEQARHIFKHFCEFSKKIRVIGISDQYNPDDPELIELIEFFREHIECGKVINNVKD